MVFDTEDFVYVPNARISQQVVQDLLTQNTLTNFLNQDFIDPLCLDFFIRALCVHYYLPCGNSTSRHVPQFLCPDTCHYIEDDLCREIWPEASAALIPHMHPLIRVFGFPNCDNPAAIISFLNLSADCCSNSGVTIPSNETVTSTTFTTNIITTSISSSSLSKTQLPAIPSDVVGISVGSTVAVLLVLACTFICLGIFFLYLRKRKITNFLDAEKYAARYTKNSFTDTAKAPSAGVHNNHVPVQLSMHTHIEQLSNVLIPKARIHLIEILGQGIYHFSLIVKLFVIVSYTCTGEFGVVYRGLLLSETKKIPEAVAVKTLKGQVYMPVILYINYYGLTVASP